MPLCKKLIVPLHRHKKVKVPKAMFIPDFSQVNKSTTKAAKHDEALL